MLGIADCFLRHPEASEGSGQDQDLNQDLDQDLDPSHGRP